MSVPTPPGRRQSLLRLGVLLALAVSALALWELRILPVDEITARYYRVFPRDVVLLAYDPSGLGGGLRQFERIYPAGAQRHDGLRIRVRTIEEREVLASASEVLDAFGRIPDEAASGRLFVRLPAPFRISKKQFRAQLDAQDRYVGESRVRLLRSIVPIVGADEGELPDTTPCRQFSDDLEYAEQNFGGFALRMDEQTLELLDGCLAAALREHLLAMQ